MNFYKVVTTSIVEADTGDDAMQLAAGNRTSIPGRIVTAWSDRPIESLSTEKGLWWVEFSNEIAAAVSTPPELYQTLDGSPPGIKFSPAAAAVIKRLNEETSSEG